MHLLLSFIMDRKRKTLTIESKYEILMELEKGVKSKVELAENFGIPKSTLSGIIKKKDEIIASFQSSSMSPSRKRHRSGTYDDVDNALYVWFKDARSNNLPLSGLFLRQKADDLAHKLGHTSFQASTGWIDRFKKRHNIVCRSISGESGSAPIDDVNEWKDKKLKALIKDYEPSDIFNADETGLFYKLLPSYTLNVKGNACIGRKQAKDRITVLIGCNMDGTEKLKLLVIGRYQNPRCFKGVNSLPVTYEWNKRSWMTGAIFQEWLRKLDNRFHAQRRKVLLIIDNCAAHPDVKGLRAIKLAYFPPNTTSMLQPCDQGVIYMFKCKYRNLMMGHIIECYDKKEEPALNILAAIRYAYSAWKAVAPDIISKCFRKCGFVKLAPEESMDDDDDIPLAQLIEEARDNIPLARLCAVSKRNITLDEVMSSDAAIQSTETLSDEVILDAVKSSSTNTDDEHDNEDDEDVDTVEPQVSKADVLTCIGKIRTYLEAQDDTDESVFSQLLSVEQCVLFSKQSQRSILDYFKK